MHWNVKLRFIVGLETMRLIRYISILCLLTFAIVECKITFALNFLNYRWLNKWPGFMRNKMGEFVISYCNFRTNISVFISIFFVGELERELNQNIVFVVQAATLTVGQDLRQKWPLLPIKWLVLADKLQLFNIERKSKWMISRGSRATP